VPPALQLLPFQVESARWLRSRRTALLAHEMGLGKTICTLAALPRGARALVFAPSVAVGVWAGEIARWRPDLRATIAGGRAAWRWPRRGEVRIGTYGCLPARPAGPAPTGAWLLGDEVHLLKNPPARRTRRWRTLARRIYARGGRVVGLTATPLLNRPEELWAVLESLGCAREAFGSRAAFDVLVDRGDASDGVLAPQLRKVMQRFLVAEVARSLPPLRRERVTVPIARVHRRRIARELARLGLVDAPSLRELLLALERGAGGEARELPRATELSRVRALLAAAKIPALRRLVRRYEQAGEPLVVLAAHRAPIEVLGRRKGWAAITGATPPARRTEIERAFQAGRLLGVAATILAGGMSITLTRARHALFVDQAWTPAWNAQAEGRIRRLGQRWPCLVQILVADHVVDRHVSAVLERKIALIDQALGLTSIGS